MEKLGAECGDLQALRELTMNGMQAIAALGRNAGGRVIWDLDWKRLEGTGGRVRKLSMIDTGIGMTPDALRFYINHLAASSHTQSRRQNFGVGAKIAAGSRNPHGLEYRSWHDGHGALVCFMRHPDGRWGLQPQTWSDGRTDFWRPLDEHDKPWALLGQRHGTQVVLLGQHERDDTITLCPDEQERRQFIGALLEAAFRSGGRIKVVMGVRADFFPHLTAHSRLIEALGGEAQVIVSPPSAVDLREIIVSPADLAGLTVDSDLLATVVAEAIDEPGALPLVSHALLETWRNRDGSSLTLAAYRASGGVKDALAKTAELVYSGFSAPERDTVRRIFQRLTALGDATNDTRRPVARTELDGLAARERVARIVDRLTRARLIVLDGETVQVAHEALISGWPRLRTWLTDDRAGLMVHRRIITAAQTWRDLDRDQGTLYRGGAVAGGRSVGR